MLSSAYHVSMEGEAPEQPQQPKPEEAITHDGRRVKLRRGQSPQEVNPLYDSKGSPVPPQIIGEVVDVKDEILPQDQ